MISFVLASYFTFACLCFFYLVPVLPLVGAFHACQVTVHASLYVPLADQTDKLHT